MSDKLLSALKAIPPASLSYQDWINVGMALKHEGLGVDVWDDWSRDDTRYKPGDCARRWNSFHGSGTPVTGGTIVELARQYGYTPSRFADENMIMDWVDVLEYDGDDVRSDQLPAAPSAQELITYLETLFERDDYVGYVTSDVFRGEDKKWHPQSGVYWKTAGQLIDSLRAHPNDMGAAIEDWKSEAGAWIRFNALDGNGVKNDNVVSWKFALVESDTIPPEEQAATYERLQLPIAALVHSANKSIHAIVRVDAANANEYRQRVTFLYDFLRKHGLEIDTANRNPSRLSRMPGVTRDGKRQKLLGVNLGRRSWADWMDYVEGVEDELPQPVALDYYLTHEPVPPPELIKGVLRRGHKMLISGSSKAGKSFLLMELCCAFAGGGRWLKFDCAKARVLYVNLEIDENSCAQRFLRIREKMALADADMKNIELWHLRGQAVPLNELVPKLVRRVQGRDFDVIIIDPIYKVITGDENNASDMAAFCNQFDRICRETGCSVIYCHHHSKGAQGGKRAMDRASGSGVFARDPDAQLDMIELVICDDVRNNVLDRSEDGSWPTGWRMVSSLREFANFQPFEFWFEYPVHKLDTAGLLRDAPEPGTWEAGRAQNGKFTSTDTANDNFRSAFAAEDMDGTGRVKITAIAKHLQLSEQAVRNTIDRMPDEYSRDNGWVFLKS